MVLPWGCTMRPQSLDEFLRRARVPYTRFRHAQAFTAQQEAQVSHVPGRSWAKVVVCVADGEPVVAVLPAPLLVDLDKLRELAGARAVRLAHEAELGPLYPEFELGAMPPFLNPHVHRVFVDPSLVGDPEMVFNAGTHTDAIRMHYGDFADLTCPIVGSIAKPSTVERAKRPGNGHAMR